MAQDKFLKLLKGSGKQYEGIKIKNLQHHNITWWYYFREGLKMAVGAIS